MDENTTTEEPVEAGAVEAQPVEAEVSEAASAPDQTEQTVSQEGPLDDNSEWLKSKGIDLSTPEGVAQLAKSYKELEKGYHEKAKKASELEKTALSGFDEAVTEDVTAGNIEADDPRIAIRKLEIKQNVRDFFDENPEAKEYEAKMAEIVVDRPHLREDLDALYALALKENVASLKSEGAKEALETLATKQRATAPAGAAVQPQAASSEPDVSKMSDTEYIKYIESKLPTVRA